MKESCEKKKYEKVKVMKKLSIRFTAFCCALMIFLSALPVFAAVKPYIIISKFSDEAKMGVMVKANPEYKTDFALFAVLYDNETVLSAVKYRRAEILNEKEIAFPYSSQNRIKLYAWDGEESMVPITDAEEFEFIRTSVSVRKLSHYGEVLSEATGEERAVITSNSYSTGDILQFNVTGTEYMWVKVATNLPEYLIYAPNGVYEFPIPTGQKLKGYDAADFKGTQTISVRVAEKEDIYSYRNLALNGIDHMTESEVTNSTAALYTLPEDSPGIEKGEVLGYPHAYANRVTRNEGAFYARNAIDGKSSKNGHGWYPYHSWGGGLYEDLAYSVYFGREVTIDKIVMTLRSDYTEKFGGLKHDTYWESFVAEFSDGSRLAFYPERHGDKQNFSFPARNTEYVKITKLIPHEDTKSQMYAALNEIEVWGYDSKGKVAPYTDPELPDFDDIAGAPVIEDGYLIGGMSVEATGFQEGNEPENLVNGVYNDNSTLSRWAAEGFPQSATVRFDRDVILKKIIIQPYGYRGYEYNLYASYDGNNYTKIGDQGGLKKHYNLAVHNINPMKVRFIKLEVTGIDDDSSNWVSIKEMFIYGEREDREVTYESVIADLKRVNDYWISTHSDLSAESNPWEVSVYHTGNMQAYYMTGDEAYKEYSTMWSRVNRWMSYPSDRETFADHFACFQNYIDIYNIDKDEMYIKDVKRLVDKITDNESLDYWYWVDAFYMAAPIWVKMYILTGDEVYLDKMYDMIRFNAESPTRNCYDEETGLWYRDRTYVGALSENCKKIFWSRGNAWVFAAFARIIEDLPDSYEHKGYFVDVFVKMAKTLKELQLPEGGWSPSLCDYEYSPQNEESGTGFFVYGMFWGINNGYLNEEEYLDCAMKGWKWISEVALQHDGKVGYAQPIGKQPTAVIYDANDTEHYAAGNFIFAASELAKYLGGVNGDILPYLQKKLLGKTEAYKINSRYGIKNGEIIEEDVPFIKEKNGNISVLNGDEYVSIGEYVPEGMFVYRSGDVIIISEYITPFNRTEGNPEVMLDKILTEGKFPQRAYSDKKRFSLNAEGQLSGYEELENVLVIPRENITASELCEVGNGAENLFDRNLLTRYAVDVVDENSPAYVDIDLMDEYDLNKIGIAFHLGNKRKTTFSVSVSMDGESYSEVVRKRESSGKTQNVEYYNFNKVSARFIRIYGYGNSVTSWFSPTELEIYSTYTGAEVRSGNSKKKWIIAENDAYITEATATVKNGATDENNILVSMNKGSSPAANRRDGMVKFDLSGYDTGVAKSITLRMYVIKTTNSGTREVHIYPVNDYFWNERTITWANASEYTNEAAGSMVIDASTELMWFSADITDYVKNIDSDIFSLRLVSDTAAVYFASREYNSGLYAPMIVIEY